MTMSEIVEDVLGVEGTFPRPGWVVLDAIRERRFTGEVVFETTPEVRVYADRGRIYLAERSSDPSLGSRLVDAGALNATQLEHGALRIGEGEYLGRLFERVPSIDRQKVIVTAELMTEECVGYLARMRISDIEVTPYRHHAAGTHRWDEPPMPAFDLAPGDPLPAPGPDAAPVALGPPEPLLGSADAVADVEDMIRWNEPSWLDERVAPLTPLKPIDVAARFAALRAAADDDERQPIALGPDPASATVGDEPVKESGKESGSDDDAPTADDGDAAPPEATPSVTGADWIDNLTSSGLPDAGSDPLASPVRLTPLTPEPPDHFELIWPSGDIDEQFGSASAGPFPHPDIDRAGVTARLMSRRARVTADPAPAPTSDPSSDQASDPTSASSLTVDPEFDPALPDDAALESWLGDEDGREAITDEVVLAVRRAVASIDTGSLAARRRLAEVPAAGVAGAPVDTGPVVMPGRVAVRTDSPGSMQVARGHVSGTSVFDSLPLVEPAPAPSDVTAEAGAGADVDVVQTERTGALRRLIGSLRRR